MPQGTRTAHLCYSIAAWPPARAWPFLQTPCRSSAPSFYIIAGNAQKVKSSYILNSLGELGRIGNLPYILPSPLGILMGYKHLFLVDKNCYCKATNVPTRKLGGGCAGGKVARALAVSSRLLSCGYLGRGLSPQWPQLSGLGLPLTAASYW